MQGKFFDFRNFAIGKDRQLDEKVVFATSETYNGNLGGLAGADAKCQERAGVAGLPGTFRAWLSDETASVSERFDRRYDYAPFLRTDRVRIANDWADLTDGTLLVAIDRDEFGNERSNRAWTYTLASGNARVNPFADCFGWTSSGNGLLTSTYTGLVTATDNQWTESTGTSGCSSQQRLYCFQQVSFSSEAERLLVTIPNTSHRTHNCSPIWGNTGKTSN